MKNKIFSILTSLILCLWALPVNVAFAEDDYSPFKGSGTSSDPYQISSDYELRLLSELVDDEDTEISDKYAKACYIQTADIDLKNEDFIPIGLYYSVNTAFAGTYNGNYHKIINLNINSDNRYCGLFGRLGKRDDLNLNSLIENLDVYGVVNSNFTDEPYVGGIVGEIAYGSKIKNCSFHGSISGKKNVGAIAGSLWCGDSIEFCYANADIKANKVAGGICGCITVGFNMIGSMDASLKNCYFVGSIESETELGGICGTTNIVSERENSVITFENNYYLDTTADTGINGHITTGCFKLNSELLKSGAELFGNPFVNNNEEDNFNDGYPIFEWQSTPYQFKGSGTAEDPYQISSKFELETMRDLVNSTYFGDKYCRYYYVQTADIDLENELFEPIGTRMKNGMDLSKPLFRGNYDGQGHEIRNLYVNKTGSDRYTGLFGSFHGAKTAIENLVVYGKVNSDGGAVGGIAGEIVNGGGIVRNCAFIGDVKGGVSSSSVGGIVGVIFQNGTIENCYHIGNVINENRNDTGGIVGQILVADHVSGNGVVKNSYHIGDVIGLEGRVGEIVGLMKDNKKLDGEIHVLNCYYLKKDNVVGANGEADSCNIIPLTESLMKKIAETLGDPFVTNTDPELNNGYPVFEWQLSSQESVIKGDANLDGNIDIADIIAIASYVGDNKNNPLSDEAIVAGDVHNTGDGLTSGDALMIQQYVAGICSLD